MSKLLFRLRNVPDDEASEVRELLSRHEIPFYETSAGNWGISMPAIWLHRDEDYPEARALLDNYQHERTVRMREQYLSDKSSGRADTTADMLRREPLRVLGYALAIVVIIYISVSIFY